MAAGSVRSFSHIGGCMSCRAASCSLRSSGTLRLVVLGEASVGAEAAAGFAAGDVGTAGLPAAIRLK